MNAIQSLLILALLAGLPRQADETAAPRTRTLEFRDGETVRLRLCVSAPDRNVLTAVTFPDLVQNVVSSWNDRDLSVEVQGAKLFLKLLAKAEGHVDVFTTSGTHLRLYIEPSPAGQTYDGHVVLNAPAAKPDVDPSRQLPEALELVRAMRVGLVPPGASVRRGGDAPVLSTGDLEGRLAFVYETTSYRGYVIRLANSSPKTAVHIDVTRFSSPRLVLIGAKSLVVAPEKTTPVYLVLWK